MPRFTVVATLDPVPSAGTWRQWFLVWDTTTGDRQLLVRATDNAGVMPISEIADEAPNGASGHHAINVTVRGNGRLTIRATASTAVRARGPRSRR